MKKKIAMLIGCLLLTGMIGCCNCIIRTEGNGAPYACAPYPYYCTVELCPWTIGTDCCGHCRYMEVGSPLGLIFVVDEVFEVALDTVFLPVDLTSLCCFTDGRRKEIAEARERRKKYAEAHERRKKRVDKADTPQSAPVIQIRSVDDSADGANATVSGHERD